MSPTTRHKRGQREEDVQVPVDDADQTGAE